MNARRVHQHAGSVRSPEFPLRLFASHSEAATVYECRNGEEPPGDSVPPGSSFYSC